MVMMDKTVRNMNIMICKCNLLINWYMLLSFGGGPYLLGHFRLGFGCISRS